MVSHDSRTNQEKPLFSLPIHKERAVAAQSNECLNPAILVRAIAESTYLPNGVRCEVGCYEPHIAWILSYEN
jgi:hypothetical protein